MHITENLACFSADIKLCFFCYKKCVFLSEKLCLFGNPNLWTSTCMFKPYRLPFYCHFFLFFSRYVFVDIEQNMRKRREKNLQNISVQKKKSQNIAICIDIRALFFLSFWFFPAFIYKHKTCAFKLCLILIKKKVVFNDFWSKKLCLMTLKVKLFYRLYYRIHRHIDLSVQKG